MSPGSDADALDGDVAIVGGGSPEMPAFACRMLDPRQARDRRGARALRQRAGVLGPPILVCTVDTLASVTDATMGRHLADSVRVATADLLLDEIDAYGPEDMVAICRLVLLAAFFGRSVIAASATLRTEHAIALRNAYAAGRNARCGQTGKPSDFLAGWFSEHLQEMVVDDGRAGADAFRAGHGDAVRRIVQSLAEAAPRRRARMADSSSCGSRAEYFDLVLAECRRLHQDNHIVDGRTGKRISVGLVRWNRISHCRSFAARLFDQPDVPDTHLAVACHHSRFSLAVRDQADRSLALMLSRKQVPGGEDPLLTDPHIRRHLDSTPECDVIVVISTTTLLEAGRDFDADWAITEPCSVRSAIQLAGRVGRHRDRIAVAANLAILSHPVQSLIPAGRTLEPALASPGAGTPARMGGGKGGKKAAVPMEGLGATELFEMDAWAGRMDAAACLAGGGGACGRAEEDMLRWIVLGERPRHNLVSVDGQRTSETARFQEVATALSVSGLVARPEWHWDDAMARRRGFRHSDPRRKDVDFRRQDGQWSRRDADTAEAARLSRRTDRPRSEWLEAACLVEEDWRPANPAQAAARLLFPLHTYDTEAAAGRVLDLMASHGLDAPDPVATELHSLTISPFASRDREPRLYFHPWLGGNQSRIIL